MRDPNKFLSPEPFWFGDLNVYNDIHNEHIRVHRKHDSNDIHNEHIRVHRKHDTVSEPVERPLLNLAHASTLVDAIEEALKACVHEDGRWKLLLATLTCVPRTHWSEAQVVSNRRATAIWVAMALAEEFRRQYLDDAAGEPESAPAAEPPIRSYPEFLRRFLPEEAERRRRAGMTPSEVAEEIGREAAAEALAAFTRAADTQEAP